MLSTAITVASWWLGWDYSKRILSELYSKCYHLIIIFLFLKIHFIYVKGTIAKRVMAQDLSATDSLIKWAQ